MPRPMRNCRVCGKEFESSPTDSTVNCPEHRKRLKVTRSNEQQEKDYINARFECAQCGYKGNRSEMYAHRRETGHSGIPTPKPFK